ncbi:hypothetical protein PR048_029563 [Dryococelus australis]|uniref:Uncharacterized protein n=1 Tax=Dryococelus australis TaxID=614101 RepID=A0ABQ9GDR1_9NEOP|nr:hypothetical protein PR048_029563 [Dryococelus australis]
MNNIIAERFDGLSEGRVYTDLDKQNGEKTDNEDSGEEMVEGESRVFIKEEVHKEEFENELFRESANDLEGYRENECSDVYAESDEGNVSQEVGADGMMGESAIDECKKEDENDIEGYILPDVKPSINSTGIEKAAVTYVAFFTLYDNALAVTI